MIQNLGIEESEVSEVNRVLYKNYTTLMVGLRYIIYVSLIALLFIYISLQKKKTNKSSFIN
ncbi:hypothetical protein WN943_013025 [Citrus x changshan-huyou]